MSQHSKPGCDGCTYYDTNTNSCDYIIREKKMREAPAIPGKGCAKRSEAERKRVTPTRLPSRWRAEARKEAYPDRMGYRVFPEAAARELYDEGKNDLEISKELGWGAQRVARWRNENGLRPLRTGRKAQRPEDYKDGIPFRLWQEGKGDAEIAALLGVPKATINSWRSRNGLASNVKPTQGVRARSVGREQPRKEQNMKTTEEKNTPAVAERVEEERQEAARKQTTEAANQERAAAPATLTTPSCERVADELAWIWQASTGEKISAEKAASVLELVDVAWRIAAGDCRGAIQRVLTAERRSRA